MQALITTKTTVEQTERSLTAVVRFIRHVSTVIVTITEVLCGPETAACVVTFHLVFTTCYTAITKTMSHIMDHKSVSELRVTGPKGHRSESVGKLNSVRTGGPALTCAPRDSSPHTTQRLIDLRLQSYSY